MSILIIGNKENKEVQKLWKEMTALNENVKFFREIGRCITPRIKEQRVQVDKEGQRGQELAKNADKVYLVRGEKVERIK